MCVQTGLKGLMISSFILKNILASMALHINNSVQDCSNSITIANML